MTDVSDYLENWAKWVTRVADCYPSTPGNWDLIISVEFKNCYETTQEKLDRVESELPPDEPLAALTERWVVSMGEPYRTAIRVQWIECPDHERHRWLQTPEQWQDRRARFLNHALRNSHPGVFHIRGADDYEEAVAGAEQLLERALTLWQRAA